jgi:DNA-binding IclR family transcriptional regulator
MSEHNDEATAAARLLPVNGIQRTFAVLRALADAPPQGMRVTQVAKAIGLTQGTTHRLLQALVAKAWWNRTSAASCIAWAWTCSPWPRAPAMPPTCAACAGRRCCACAAAWAIPSSCCCARASMRSAWTVSTAPSRSAPSPATSAGASRWAWARALAILAFLPEQEREEVIRYNVPRLREFGVYDEVYLRTEIERVRETGYAARQAGLLDGMAGLACRCSTAGGAIVGALSVGTLTSRLTEERLPTVVQMLQREAAALSRRINPFDPALRPHAPGQSCGAHP